MNSRLNLGLQTSRKWSTAQVRCKSHSCCKIKPLNILKYLLQWMAGGCGSMEKMEGGVLIPGVPGLWSQNPSPLHLVGRWL